MHPTYYSLFFVAMAALASPWLSARVFRGTVPAVILEIALGAIIGPQVLDVASTTDQIDFLAAFGFSYLMFLSGIELDFSLLFTRQSSGQMAPWARGLLFFSVTLAISFVLSLMLLQFGFSGNWFVTMLILSTTSVGIVTPALKEKGWLADPFGQEVMLYALIADVSTLVLFTGYVTFHSTGNAFSLLLVLVVLLAFVIVYRLVRAILRHRSLGLVESATSEIGLRGSFALILAFVALSKSLETEVVIGAFLAGAIISLLSEKHSLLTRKLNSIGYGFLLPIFFVNVGMTFNIGALAGTVGFWLALLFSLAGMYLNKLVPAALLLRRFAPRLRLSGGLLLSSRLSLLIAASQIASQAGILSESAKNGFILLAVVTCFLSPLLFNRTLVGVLPAGGKRKDDPAKITIDKDTLPEGWELGQLEVRMSWAEGVELRSLRLSQELLVLSIVRADERIVPRGRTALQLFDMIQVIGDPLELALLRQRLEGGR